MGPLKFLNLYYDVLQLNISNFKSTGGVRLGKLAMPCWIIQDKKRDKTFQT